jgi:hypothetical protein
MCGFYKPETIVVPLSEAGQRYGRTLEAMTDEELLAIASAEVHSPGDRYVSGHEEEVVNDRHIVTSSPGVTM